MGRPRIPVKQKAEYKRFIGIRNYIGNNKKIFKVGSEFGSEELVADFGVKLPITKGKKKQIMLNVTRYNSKRAEWQNKFNRVLAQRGLYMAHRVDKFQIKTQKETEIKVVKFREDAQRKIFRSDELETGIENYGCVYTKVTNLEIAQIVLNLHGRPSGGMTL